MNPRFEMVQSDTYSSFRSLLFECSSFAEDHPWHYHPEYELTWIIRSEGTRFVGDSIRPYGAGDLVLIGPNLPHCWQNESDGGRPRPQLILVQFDPACFGAAFLDLPELRAIKSLLERAGRGLSFDAAASVRVGTLLRNLVERQDLSRLARLLEILDVLATIQTVVPLASCGYQIFSNMNPGSRRKMDLVRRYVSDHMAEEIRQAQVAECLGLSSPAFSHFFRAATGETFVQFVNRARVHEACKLLSATQATIIEIAMRCGYENISNFNRQFRALRGMSPSEYRHSLRQRAEREARCAAGTRFQRGEIQLA